MALSNAERQRRYRDRLKARALSGSEFVCEMNRAYAEGRAAERARLLPLLRGKAKDLSPDVFAIWAQFEDALESPDRAITNEYWKQYGRELGQQHEELLLTQLLRECINRSNIAIRPVTAGPRKELLPVKPTQPSPADIERDREEQLRMADRFERLLRRSG